MPNPKVVDRVKITEGMPGGVIGAAVALAGLWASAVFALKVEGEFAGEWLAHMWLAQLPRPIIGLLLAGWAIGAMWFAHRMHFRRLWVGTLAVLLVWLHATLQGDPTPLLVTVALLGVAAAWVASTRTVFGRVLGLLPLGLLILLQVTDGDAPAILEPGQVVVDRGAGFVVVLVPLVLTFLYELIKQNLSLGRQFWAASGERKWRIAKDAWRIWWLTLVFVSIGIVSGWWLHRELDELKYTPLTIRKMCTIKSRIELIECEEAPTTIGAAKLREDALKRTVDWPKLVEDAIEKQRRTWFDFIASSDDDIFQSADDFLKGITAQQLELGPVVLKGIQSDTLRALSEAVATLSQAESIVSRRTNELETAKTRLLRLQPRTFRFWSLTSNLNSPQVAAQRSEAEQLVAQAEAARDQAVKDRDRAMEAQSLTAGGDQPTPSEAEHLRNVMLSLQQALESTQKLNPANAFASEEQLPEVRRAIAIGRLGAQFQSLLLSTQVAISDWTNGIDARNNADEEGALKHLRRIIQLERCSLEDRATNIFVRENGRPARINKTPFPCRLVVDSQDQVALVPVGFTESAHASVRAFKSETLLATDGRLATAVQSSTAEKEKLRDHAHAFQLLVPSNINLGRDKCRNEFRDPIGCLKNSFKRRAEGRYQQARQEAGIQYASDVEAASVAAQNASEYYLGRAYLAVLEDIDQAAKLAHRSIEDYRSAEMVFWALSVLLLLFAILKSILVALGVVVYDDEGVDQIGLSDATPASERSTVNIAASYTVPLEIDLAFVSRGVMHNQIRSARLFWQPHVAIVGRLLRGAYALLNFGGHATSKHLTAAKGMILAPEGARVVGTWEVQPNEKIVFGFREFFAASENVVLRSEVSLRLSSLIMGRLFVVTAEVPKTSTALGYLLFVVPSGSMSTDVKITERSRLLAWRHSEEFIISSGKNWRTMYIDGYQFQLAPDHNNGILVGPVSPGAGFLRNLWSNIRTMMLPF